MIHLVNNFVVNVWHMSDVVPDAMNPMVNKAQYPLLRNHVIVEDRKKPTNISRLTIS